MKKTKSGIRSGSKSMLQKRALRCTLGIMIVVSVVVVEMIGCLHVFMLFSCCLLVFCLVCIISLLVFMICVNSVSQSAQLFGLVAISSSLQACLSL